MRNAGCSFARGQARLAFGRARSRAEEDFHMKLRLAAGAVALWLAMPVAAQMPQGPIARADFMTQSKAQFAALDADKDGVITRDEMVAGMTKMFGNAPPPEIVDRLFGAIDLDKDGKATAAEVEKHAADRFDNADANHDGTLTADEIAASRQAAMAAQKPQ